MDAPDRAELQLVRLLPIDRERSRGVLIHAIALALPDIEDPATRIRESVDVVPETLGHPGQKAEI
jgi:hypothetical protein